MATVGGEEDFKGQYHAHPYGEINCVVPIDEGAELRGLNGWMGKGWTSPREFIFVSLPFGPRVSFGCYWLTGPRGVQTLVAIITPSAAGAVSWRCSFYRRVGSVTTPNPRMRCLLVLDLLFPGKANEGVVSLVTGIWHYSPLQAGSVYSMCNLPCRC